MMLKGLYKAKPLNSSYNNKLFYYILQHEKEKFSANTSEDGQGY